MTLLAPLLLALVVAGSPAAQPSEVVESIVVHGNHTTPTDEVLALVGPVTGQPATDTLIAEVRARLDKSGRFAGVELRKRFLSIDDPTRVLLVIVVDEHEAVSEDDLTPGAMKRFGASSMWLPVLEYQEGYGFTYGARVSFMDRLGPRSRISVPLTWGGERQAQLEIERGFERGAVRRVVGGGGLHRRENPFYEIGDFRQVVWGRVESAPRPWLRAGLGARLAQVGFGALDERLGTFGADVAIDTRRDPALPRNAVYASLGVERLGFDTSALGVPAEGDPGLSARRLTFDGRGYVGLFGQMVLAVRAQSSTASDPLPPFEKALLGGIPSLRGWDVGSGAGDNLAAASAEILMPLTSPLKFARLGVKLFADTGATYDAGQAMADQVFRWGYGGGVFLNATVFSFGLDLGWREGRSTPNAHVQFGVRLK